MNKGKGRGKNSSPSSVHRETQTYVQISMSYHLCLPSLCTSSVCLCLQFIGYAVLIRRSVHMFGLLYVHLRRMTFSLSLYLGPHQGSPPHQFRLLSSLFPNCTQNDVTCPRFSLSVGLEKTQTLTTHCLANPSSRIERAKSRCKHAAK